MSPHTPKCSVQRQYVDRISRQDKRSLHIGSIADPARDKHSTASLSSARSWRQSLRQIAGATILAWIRTENVPWHGRSKCHGQNPLRISATGTNLILYDQLWWGGHTYWQRIGIDQGRFGVCAISRSRRADVARLHHFGVCRSVLWQC